MLIYYYSLNLIIIFMAFPFYSKVVRNNSLKKAYSAEEIISYTSIADNIALILTNYTFDC